MTNTQITTLYKLAIEYAEETATESVDWIGSVEEAQAWAQEFMPDDLSELVKYKFRLTGSIKTYDGEAWTGVLRRNGKDVVWVENDGHGGPNMYRCKTGEESRKYFDACDLAFPAMQFERSDHATSLLDILAGV